MTLGQKIRAARIERSMTQKQLVGDQITRNMLSKIENDSATPSVRTLEYLAGRLGLNAGYFLSELDSAPEIIPDGLYEMRRAYREGRYLDCMQLLRDNREACATDEGFLLRAKCAIAAARESLLKRDFEAAKEYADDADYYNKQGIYYSAEIDAEMSLILAECALVLDISEFETNAGEFNRAVREISFHQRYSLAYCEYLLRTGEDELAVKALENVKSPLITATDKYLYLKGECALRAGNINEAEELLLAAEALVVDDKRLAKTIYAALEAVYTRLEDYKQAYKYASLQLRSQDTEGSK